MTKKTFLTLTCALTMSMNLSAQSWSETITTGNLITANGAGPLGGPYQQLSGFELRPDAVTINRDNDNSGYPIGTVFSMYSMVNGASYAASPLPSSIKSLWIKAVGDDGTILLSKGIEMPYTFDYLKGGAGAGNLLSSGHLIAVNSLVYYGDDILVFTGELSSDDSNTSSSKRFTTMIVGTYDLKTNDFKFDYFDKKEKTISLPNGSTKKVLLNSKGTGINYMTDNHYFQAIGKTINHANGDTQMENPISWVVDINASNGSISTIEAVGFNVDYVPTSVAKNSNPNGYDTFVVGAYQPETAYSTSCPGYPSADFGLGSFHFKFNNLTNETTIQDVHIAYSEEFENNRSFPNDIKHPTVFQESAGELYVAYTKYNGSLDEYTVFGGLGIDYLTPAYYSLQTYSGLGTYANSGFQMTDKDRYVELSLKITDDNSISGRTNNTSIGIIQLKKSDLAYPLLPVKELFSNDDPELNIRNFNHITAVSSLYEERYVDYYFADGSLYPTDKSRAHIYGIINEDFEDICHEDLETSVMSVCFEDEKYTDDLEKWTTINSTRYSLSTITNYDGALVNDVHGDIFNCYAYNETPQATYSPIQTDNEMTAEKNMAYTKVYTYEGNVFMFEKSDAQILKIALYDMNGRLILTNSNRNKIDAGLLPKGLYMVRISYDDTTTRTEKIVVQ